MQRIVDWRISRAHGIGSLAFACLALFPGSAAAQQRYDCGHGLELRLSSPISSQGSLLLVETRNSEPITELQAEFVGQRVVFWTDRQDERLHHALLGIDLEKPVGKYNLTVTAQVSGRNAGCLVPVSVRAGRFTTERLRVAKQFVEINPADLERTDRERRRLRELYATATPERFWQGSFQIPLRDTRWGRNFGRRRVLNGEPGSPHSGADFPAPPGTPVHAAQRGRVVLAENLFFSGNTVLLDHGLGIYTLYGHFESSTVAAGDLVEAGTVLGRVGATGRVTGPHLHWGLVVNGARVNPLQIVALLSPFKEVTKTKQPSAKTKPRTTLHRK